jgi:hypothetical protein
MSFPAQTTGVGVAAKIIVAGNVAAPAGKFQVPGYNNLFLSLSGTANPFPTSFQLNPEVVDVKNNGVSLGTAYTVTAVAAAVPGPLTLSAAAVSVAGAQVLTGTFATGGSNGLAGYTVVVTGFSNATNNGTFEISASTTTTITINNALGLAETHAAVATPEEGTAVYTGTFTGVGTALTLSAAAANGVYTGTITGGAANALVGKSYIVAGFANALNNGTFFCTASTATTLTLDNPNSVAVTAAGTATQTLNGHEVVVAGFVTNPQNNGIFIVTASSSTTATLDNPVAVAETHAATATDEATSTDLTYFSDGTAVIVGYSATGPNTNLTARKAVVSVSPTGLVTAQALGESVVEVSFPVFNNTSGATGALAPNPMAGLPSNKIYAEVNVTVLA